MENEKLPLYEMKINLDDDDTGLYAISFVDEPATLTEWYAFNKNECPYENHLKFLEDNINFDEMGIPADELRLIGEDFAPSIPNSVKDNTETTYLYRYIAHSGERVSSPNSRNFCRNLINANRYYTVGDIETMSNPGQGPNGSNVYNILRYRGGLNCKHVWKRYIYDVEEKTVKADPSWSESNQPFPVPRYNPQFNRQKFNTDEKKQLITAPIMLANTPIYRFHYSIGEYEVVFRPEVIMDMMKKYMSSNKKDNVNEQHDGNRVVNDVYLVESFIVDDRLTLNGVYADVPKGSWFGTFYIKDKDYYNKLINSDDFNGFSLEGMFEEVFVEQDELVLYNYIERVVLDDKLTDDEKYEKLNKAINSTPNNK